MDHKDDYRDAEFTETDSNVIIKSAAIKAQEETSQEDMRKINKLALVPLTAEEVFTFKVVMADNETDDRNYEPFNLAALKDLKKLYIGKTMIKDHRRTANNQVARIYDTELITGDKVTGAGEVYTQLIGKCYMVKTSSNADLITEIKAGIKKEVSTGCMPKKAVCSICGTDNMKSYCAHWGGQEYDKPDGTKATCYFTLDGAKEAYELSFVAVPAQPRAGAIKRHQDAQKSPVAPIEEPEAQTLDTNTEKQETALVGLNLRLREIDSFIFQNKHQEDTDNEQKNA